MTEGSRLDHQDLTDIESAGLGFGTAPVFTGLFVAAQQNIVIDRGSQSEDGHGA